MPDERTVRHDERPLMIDLTTVVIAIPGPVIMGFIWWRWYR